LYFKVHKTNCATTEHLSTAEIPVKLGGLDKWEVLFHIFLEHHIPIETTEFCCSSSVNPFQDFKIQHKSTD